jgi:hypothetical protein
MVLAGGWAYGAVQLERPGEVLLGGRVVAAGQASPGAVVEGERFAVAVPGATR